MPLATILPSAESDLADIWDYIAQNSPDNADRLIDRIFQTCQENLASSPHMGRPREELSPGLSSLIIGDYIIFYRTIDSGVEVVRVLHGRRDIEGILGP